MNKTHIIEAELTKSFKGKYLDERVFARAVDKINSKYFMPAGYGPKAIIDPYSKRIIRVECVKV